MTLASPAVAKGGGKAKGDSSATKGNYAVVLDLATGGCEVRKLDAQAEPPLGTKVLDVYETQKAADSAKETSAKCQSNSHQGDSARTVAHIHAAEQDCQARARKSDSTLVRLLSDLVSGVTEQTIYADCMKANGYAVTQ